MERAAFLDRIRRRLDLEPVTNAAHPIREPADLVPLPVHATPVEASVTAFIEAATGVDAVVRRAGSRSALDEAFSEILSKEQPRTALRSEDPEMTLLPRSAADLPPATDPANADIGITGALAGIASTGSLVVDSARAGGRLASLLPAVHVALLSADRIVATPSDWWRSMDRNYPSGPPSQIVLVTGPSRSADIELTLTLGVHGPQRLWIVVIDGGLAAAPVAPAS
jgi:L-lactate dehydrogenase complex protein LldG